MSPRSMCHGGTSAVLAILLTVTAGAQTVKQGDVKTNAAYEFHSPMIIETVFAPADRTLWKHVNWTPDKPKPWTSGDFTTAEYYDLGKYSCDGISLSEGHRDGTWNSGLNMGVKTSGTDTRVTIEAHVTNPGNVEDRLVTILFEAVNGDEVIGKATAKIKARQSWRHKPAEDEDDTKLIVPTSSITKDTKLRITMTTRGY